MANEQELFDLLQKKYASHVEREQNLAYETFAPKKEAPIVHTSRPGDAANWQEPKKYENTWMSKYGDPVYDTLTQTPGGASLLGLGEGVHESGASIANLFRGDEDKIKQLNLQDYVDPEVGGYHTGGKIGGNILTDYLLLRGAGNTLRGATGLPGLGARIGASAGIMGATGEHFPEWLGGRKGAAALGALFPVTVGSTSGEIGKNIVKAGQEAEAKYGGKIGEQVAKAGTFNKPRYTEALQNFFSKNIRLNPEYASRDVVGEFLASPSGELAQKAMSTLKAEQRSMLSHTHPKVSTLPEGSQKAYHALGDMIKDIEKQMEKSMTPDVFAGFKESLKEYAGKAAPYKQSAIEGARKGTGPAKNIPKSIGQMEKYSKTLPGEEGAELVNQFQYLMKQHPELYINKMLPMLAKGGGAAGLAALLAEQLGIGHNLFGPGDEESYIGNN